LGQVLECGRRSERLIHPGSDTLPQPARYKEQFEGRRAIRMAFHVPSDILLRDQTPPWPGKINTPPHTKRSFPARSVHTGQQGASGRSWSPAGRGQNNELKYHGLHNTTKRGLNVELRKTWSLPTSCASLFSFNVCCFFFPSIQLSIMTGGGRGGCGSE